LIILLDKIKKKILEGGDKSMADAGRLLVD